MYHIMTKILFNVFRIFKEVKTMPMDITGTYLLGAQEIVGLVLNSNNINDPSNLALRNAILNYTSGQQTNNITSLTQQAIQQAQQAQQASQQGGSGSGGGTSPTNTGISAFNGDQNFQNRLNYLEQSALEQFEGSFKGFLDYCNTDPIAKSILNYGKNSPYLSDLSPEQAEMTAKNFKILYEKAVAISDNKQRESYSVEQYKMDLKVFSEAFNFFGDFSIFYALKEKDSLVKNFKLTLVLDGLNIAVKGAQLDIAKKELLEKYPDYESHTIDYGMPISVWQGPAPFGIEIPPAYENQFQLRARDYWAKRIDRENNADMYNKIDAVKLAELDFECAQAELLEAIIVKIGTKILCKGNLKVEALIGAGASLYVKGLYAYVVIK